MDRTTYFRFFIALNLLYCNFLKFLMVTEEWNPVVRARGWIQPLWPKKPKLSNIIYSLNHVLWLELFGVLLKLLYGASFWSLCLKIFSEASIYLLSEDHFWSFHFKLLSEDSICTYCILCSWLEQTVSARSSFYENKVLLTKPFQACQNWHQVSVYENKVLVQNYEPNNNLATVN